MQFEKTIRILQQRLSEPLPGEKSHLKFMHAGRLKYGNTVPINVRKSAVLILFYPVENKAFFPLILRPKYDGKHGGQMALPGGKAEHSDETLIRTALREAQEEVGIKAIDVQVLGELTDVYIPVSNFIVRPVVGYLNYKPEFFPDSREVDKIYITNVDEILLSDTVVMKNISVGNTSFEVPGFEIQDSWVWGATAFILSELSDILRQDR